MKGNIYNEVGSVLLTSKSQRSPPRLECMTSQFHHILSHSLYTKLFPSHSQVTPEASWASFTENGDAHRLILSAIPTLTISFFTIVKRADPNRRSKFNLRLDQKVLLNSSITFVRGKLQNSTSCCWLISFPFLRFVIFECGSGGLYSSFVAADSIVFKAILMGV